MGMQGVTSLGSGMGKGFYMKLLVAQLQHQDPMDPLSNSDMITQMAQLSTVEAMDGMSTSFGEVLKLQQLLGGTELLGRQVQYTDGGQPKQGVVEAVSTGGKTIKVVVDQKEIGLDHIERIL